MATALRASRIRWGVQAVVAPPIVTGLFPWPGFTPLRTVNVINSTELATALAAAIPGDDIVLANGLYTAPGDQNEAWHGEWSLGMQGGSVRSGTAVAPIRVRSANLWGARLAHDGSNGAVLGTGGASWIIFDGLTVDEHDTPIIAENAGAIALGNRNFRSGNCIVANCRVIGKSVAGIFVDPALDNHPGIRVQNTDNCLLVNNYIAGFHGFDYSSWHQNGAGVMTYHTVGLTVANNTVEYCGSAIYIKGNNRGTIVQLNRTFGCEKGLKTSYANNDEYDDDADLSRNDPYPGAAGTPLHFRRNLILNGDLVDGRSNVNSVGIDIAETTHYVFAYNNTVVGCNVGIVANNLNSTASKIFNNILSGCAAYGGGYQLNPVNGAASAAFDYIDRNVYFGGQDRFWWHQGGAVVDLTTWRANSGFDANSVQTDPQLDAAGMPIAVYTRTLGRDTLNAFGGGVNSVIPVGAFLLGTETMGRAA